jgi:hypothetical protein
MKYGAILSLGRLTLWLLGKGALRMNKTNILNTLLSKCLKPIKNMKWINDNARQMMIRIHLSDRKRLETVKRKEIGVISSS